MANKHLVFEPDYAVPPGETLREVLESLGMAQTELSLRTGLTVQTISRVLKGKQPITFETASKLELATGVPARMWNNLEAYFREQQARLGERGRLREDADWLAEIPVKELIKRKVLADEKDKATLVRSALAFYGVSSVSAWQAYWHDQAIAARSTKAFESQPGPTSAWIRLGELKSQECNCQPYDRPSFVKALGRVRALTIQSPRQFVPAMRQECSKCGVAVCLVPEMPGMRWYGASKWLTPTKAMILLGLRGKREDQFWFSFFHEAGHILNDSRKDVYINDGTRDDRREKDADTFATSLLVPPQFHPRLQCLKTKTELIAFAKETGISPGIVAGQFQHLTHKWNWFNGLKRKFTWTS